MFAKSKFFVLFFLTVTCSVSAQEPVQTPPPEIIAAAQRAFPEYDRGATFDYILKSGGTMPDPIVIARTYSPLPEGSVRSATIYPSQHVTALVAKSDFVAIGTPLKRWSYSTIGNSFAVSIYLIHLDQITVPGKEQFVGGRDIYIVRPGGPFIFKGHSFRAIDTDFPLFHLNEQYLFFGARVAPNLYKVDSESTLKVEGSSLFEVSNKPRYANFYSTRNKEMLLQEASAAWQERADKRVTQ